MGVGMTGLGTAGLFSQLQQGGQRPGLFSAYETYGRKPPRDFKSIWEPGRMGRDKGKILNTLGNQQAKKVKAKPKTGVGYAPGGMPNMEIL